METEVVDSSPRKRNRSASVQALASIPWRLQKRLSVEAISKVFSTSQSTPDDVSPRSPVRLEFLNVVSVSSPTPWDNMQWTPRLTSRRQTPHEELVDSEMYYIRNLEIFCEYFVIPMKEQQLVEDHVHTAIFQGLEDVYKCNKMFSDDLKKLVPKGPHIPLEQYTKIGTLFRSMAPMFHAYSSILSNYKFALDLINYEKKRNRKLATFLEKTSRTMCEEKHRLTTLEGYLITPAQRLPRYVLLLTDILRTLDEGTEPYNQISEAGIAMNSVIQACMKEVIAYQLMLDACRIFCHSKYREMCRYIAPHRRLLAQETNSNIFVDDGSDDGKEQCDLFLLTDLLIIQMTSHKFSKAIALRKNDFCPETGFVVSQVEIKILDDKCFAIVCQYEEHEEKKRYTCFFCNSASQMTKISDGLMKCLNIEKSSRRSNSHLRKESPTERCLVM